MQNVNSSADAVALSLLATHFDESLGLQRRLRRPRALVYGGAVTLLAMLLWLSVAKVDRVVQTQGRVVPSGKQQLVQHLEGGIVSQVFVREGDIVTKGQRLIAVSDLLANSSQGEKRARLEGLAARMALLQAEADGSLSLNAAGSGPSVSTLEMQQQNAAFNARKLRLRDSLQVLEEQLSQKKQEAAEQEVRRKGLAQELEVARQQLALVSAMMAKNAASQLELLDARGRVEKLTTQIRESEAAIPRLQSAAQELKARSSEILAQFRSDARTALADARVEQQRLANEIGADDDRVSRTTIVAPMSGTVNKLLFNTVGGVVRPGETLMELTPTDVSVALESRVLPTERGALQVGQAVLVKVGAFDFTTYGVLKGQIREISADSLVDERNERYFRLSVDVEPESLQQFRGKVTPGMTVTADVVTGQRTILEFLLSPIRGLASTAFRDQK